ncbi:hypothetical protein [Streptomyces anulatus]|uniref:hypothetical protein n=1 Tax=Streptomyces anulatus TaxID=1892 RepID=UPI002F914AF3
MTRPSRQRPAPEPPVTAARPTAADRPETTMRPVRVHGGRADHTAREERPGRWRMLCGALPVHPDDFTRTLCGIPCTGCARALADTADPAGAALRSHSSAVQRREDTGQPPLPRSEPRPPGVPGPAQRELTDSLQLYRRLALDPSWRHPTFADLVLEHGRWYPPAPWPAEQGWTHTPGRCFEAAHTWADRAGWTYVEGYALVHGTWPVAAIEHAWCLTGTGAVADPALPDGFATAYCGVPLTDAFRRARPDGRDAVLTVGSNLTLGPNTAVLRTGLPPHALAGPP